MRAQLARGRAKSAATRAKNSIGRKIDRESIAKAKEIKQLQKIQQREETSKSLELQIKELKNKLLNKTDENEEVDEYPESEEEEEIVKPRKNKKKVVKRVIKPKKKKVVYVEESESSESESEEEVVVVKKKKKKKMEKQEEKPVEREVSKPVEIERSAPIDIPARSFKSYAPIFHQF